MTSWCQRPKVKLGVPALCVLATWVAVVAATYIAVLVYRSWQEDLPAPEPAIFVPRLMVMGLACVGAISYLHVGFRAPRLIPVHLHGVVLMVLLAEMLSSVVVELLQHYGNHIAEGVLAGFVYGTWGARRALLLSLMTPKMAALADPAHRCIRIEALGSAARGFTLVLSFGAGVPLIFWNIAMVLRGIPVAVVIEARRIGRTDGVPLADSVVVAALLTIAFICTLGNLVVSSAYMLVAARSTRSALTNLRERRVTEEMLSKAQRTLCQHLVGVVTSLLSNNVLIVATVLDVANLIEEHTERQMTLFAYLVDVAGDVTGTLLLSGVGELLIHEDPEAGNIGGHIRGVLHAAVLTSRAEIAFEGCLVPTPERACIVSFPGKFMSDWNALTWLCDQGNLSSACVFLPTSDPQQRFGQHSENPDTPGKCWCTTIYGKVKPWGCLWFDAWRANIERAVELQLELIVVFFPGQAGMGLVDWDDLRRSDLWDGIGLGGSQKAETDYLLKAGYHFIAEDIDETRQRIRCLTHTTKPRAGPPTNSFASVSTRSTETF